MNVNFPKLKIGHLKTLVISQKFTLAAFFGLTAIFIVSIFVQNSNLTKQNNQNIVLAEKLKDVSLKLKDLKNQDQYKINQNLKENIRNIETSYKNGVSLYKKILDLKAQKQDTKDLDKEFAQSLNFLSDLNYSSGSASLKVLAQDIKKKEDELAAAQVQNSTPQNITQSNTPPSGGFSVQSVSTDNGSFTVYIVAADLNSTRVIVDTASDGDCSNNCPTLSLSDYASRNGAFAGINGTYFCPAEYPSCAGKTNSFDLLVMNKNKVYFNASNNVYSTNPAVIFSGNSARFVGQALQWGRDTGVDSVLSNYPLLVSGGNVAYSGGGDAKFAPKGPRDFIANKGNTVYIGTIFGASMDDAAKVLKTLGMENALNLDEGGSTALWYGGYKVGPGRNIPNAILFVRK
ncbi:MAG: phosphodiester glycosidase family protein [Patescibacteria group bacterium]|nr:phosphodiester glycosidase family protein [Patescibacteria group bacterium]